MELYMMNIQHGRMTLESVKNGPLIWPTIEENGVTRPRKYSKLTPAEAIQADCDVKATNIILQGLPPKVYALVSNLKVAKELCERIQLLMQGTSLMKQEKECKLYDKFNKFAYKEGETLRDFYLRFSLLLNDVNILVKERQEKDKIGSKPDKNEKPTMTDNRTMAEMLCAPAERCAEAIVVPPILAEQFELKHSLINMMTSKQFFGLEKDNPHDHIRWGSPPVARKRTPAFHYHLG
nr:reverse transcriptase domain-containing protein [Tanacetum cinerariifolium]